MGERTNRWLISSAPTASRGGEAEPDTSSETVRMSDLSALLADQEDTRPSQPDRSDRGAGERSGVRRASRPPFPPPSVTIVAPVPSRPEDTGSLPLLELDDDDDDPLPVPARPGPSSERAPQVARRVAWWVPFLSAATGMLIGTFALLIVLFALVVRG